ncbi:MAG: hypothetical protein P8L40_06565 [Planktomarina sp.]|nr:hypothetical protein [Planktomarina sp.]
MAKKYNKKRESLQSSREERLKVALKKNMARRKKQAKARAAVSNKNMSKDN